jgi:hypothetical protein
MTFVYWRIRLTVYETSAKISIENRESLRESGEVIGWLAGVA